jgi:hypothetical protein
MPPPRVPTAPATARTQGTVKRPAPPAAATATASDAGDSPFGDALPKSHFPPQRVSTAPHKPSPYAVPLSSAAPSKAVSTSSNRPQPLPSAQGVVVKSPGRARPGRSLPPVSSISVDTGKRGPAAASGASSAPQIDIHFDDDEDEDTPLGAAHTNLCFHGDHSPSSAIQHASDTTPTPQASRTLAPVRLPQVGANITPDEREHTLHGPYSLAGNTADDYAISIEDVLTPRNKDGTMPPAPLDPPHASDRKARRVSRPPGAGSSMMAAAMSSSTGPGCSPERSDPLRLPSEHNIDGRAVSPHQRLAQLDALRANSVESGRLLDAQRCLDEMRVLASSHGQRVARDLKAPKATEFAKRQLQERHRTQLLKFTSLWEAKLLDFEQKAEQAMRELRQRRQREYDDLEDVIRGALAEQRPHFSSQVVNTRKELDKLIRNAKYAEAHKLKAELETMVASEERKFEELTSIRFAQQTRTLKRRLVAEVKALRMRIQLDREQLIGQRHNDHDTLMQRQANEVIGFEQRVKTEKAKAVRDIDRKLLAMTKGDGIKNFDLRAFNRIAENALADVVGAPLSPDDDGQYR